jgi:hypothetical protein
VDDSSILIINELYRPTIVGEEALSSLSAAQETVEELARYCSDIPSSSTQLVILLILVLVYYGT